MRNIKVIKLNSLKKVAINYLMYKNIKIIYFFYILILNIVNKKYCVVISS